jgi:hypothetical protein
METAQVKEKNVLEEILTKKKLEPEYIRSSLKIFTPLERGVIEVLNDSETPLTIMRIRGEFIDDVHKKIISLLDKDINENNEYIQKLEKEMKKRQLSLPQLPPKLIRRRFKSKEISENLPKDYLRLKISTRIALALSRELVRYFKDEKKSVSDKQRKYYELFSKAGIRIPSFSAIENALNELINLGFVMMRETLSGKSKRGTKPARYYYSEPSFDVFLKRIRYGK